MLVSGNQSSCELGNRQDYTCKCLPIDNLVHPGANVFGDAGKAFRSGCYTPQKN
jgi:hypothetical protein